MTPRLGTSPAAPQHPSTLRTKFVDEAPARHGFSGLDVARLGHVGTGIVRERLRKKFAGAIASSAESAKAAALADRIPTARKMAAATAARKASRDADAALAALFVADTAAPAAPAALSSEEVLAADFADLDREEAGNSNIVGTVPFLPPRLSDLSPEARNHHAIFRFLPPELAEFLSHMRPTRRAEREKAILKKVEWLGLEVLAMTPAMLAERAETEARRHAAKFPKAAADGTPINQEPEHKKRRCQKWQLRRLRKVQKKALLYVEQAVGAVGGPDGLALFLSDYGLVICEAEELRTREILDRLRLVKKLDPSVQIPMLDLHWKAKAADAAKKRLLIDVHLARWSALGWSVCWLTVTLPPEYVANATNEERRVTGWDVELGPEEASAKLQEEHHRTLNLLREKGVRLSGWWNVQPQQSGTPHRHYVVACETLEDARKVCDEFHRRFDTGNQADDGQDRGCAAYVIGDDNPKYAPRMGKNGREETAESVARYAARYSTKYETRPANAAAGGDEEAASKSGDEQKRFRGWKKLRGARGMGFLGLDSQRAPMELWDVLWLNSLKEDERWFRVEDARMSIAMREMRAARKRAEDAATFRATAKAAREVSDAMEAAVGTMPEEELASAVAGAEAAEAKACEAAKETAFHGWHAAVAMGLWPDADLDPRELAWLNDAVAEWNQGRWALPDGRQRDIDPLPPVPLREERESVYGVQRNEIRGAVGVARRFALSSRRAKKAELFETAADAGFLDALREKIREKREETGKKVGLTATRRLFFLAARDAGLGLSHRPDGTISGFDLSGEILLRSDDEWMIVAAEEAERLKEEVLESGGAVAPSAGALSFGATDPRNGPNGPPRADDRPPG